MKKIGIMLIAVVIILSGCNGQVVDDTKNDKALERENVTEPISTDQGQEETEVPEQVDEPKETVENPKEDKASEVIEQELEVEETATVVDYNALGVNEVGHIMVVMYHGIKDVPPYHITKEAFLNDLNYMYDHDYCLISMSDYLDQTIDIPAGKTPIVFTFDDALPSTFSLVEEEGELVVAPDTAIGILEDFSKEHPEFGKAASLYIHDSQKDFDGDGTVTQRLQWLIDHGYEIGNHSATHANFSNLSKESLTKEIGRVEAFVKEQGFDYNMRAITYPFGARPSEALMPLVEAGEYEGNSYSYEVAFREGPSMTLYAPSDLRFSPFNAPRVRGSSGEVQDMWWFLDYYDNSNSNLKYISDGDPTTIVVPEAMVDRVNVDKYSELELITYGQQ